MILNNPFVDKEVLMQFLDTLPQKRGIYLIEMIDQKICYIGQSVGLEKRMLRHYKYFAEQHIYRKSRSSQKFYNIIKESHAPIKLEILEFISENTSLTEHETKWQMNFYNLGYKVFGGTTQFFRLKKLGLLKP